MQKANFNFFLDVLCSSGYVLSNARAQCHGCMLLSALIFLLDRAWVRRPPPSLNAVKTGCDRLAAIGYSFRRRPREIISCQRIRKVLLSKPTIILNHINLYESLQNYIFYQTIGYSIHNTTVARKPLDGRRTKPASAKRTIATFLNSYQRLVGALEQEN
jgi:hypothetical protein